jgi:hypothetical protein
MFFQAGARPSVFPILAAVRAELAAIAVLVTEPGSDLVAHALQEAAVFSAAAVVAVTVVTTVPVAQAAV